MSQKHLAKMSSRRLSASRAYMGLSPAPSPHKLVFLSLTHTQQELSSEVRLTGNSIKCGHPCMAGPPSKQGRSQCVDSFGYFPLSCCRALSWKQAPLVRHGGARA